MAYLPSTPITVTFYHSTASLGDSDFTKNLFCNGEVKSNRITVVEVVDNYYKATFTPTMAATWDLHLEESSERHHFSFDVDSEETLQLIRNQIARVEFNTRA